MAHLFRQLAEAVHQLGSERVDVRPVLKPRQPAIEPKPQLQIANVGLGDEHRGAQRYLRAPLLHCFAEIAALETCDSLLQHRLIKLESDLPDMPRLLLAEQ